MENLKKILAKNLVKLRKEANMTQSELAEKLNYSDKAVSKWERGESTPDIEILFELSRMYNVTIDELLTSEELNIKIFSDDINKNFLKNKKRTLITIISSLLVWVIATLLFVLTMWFFPDFEKSWLVFIYAIPTCTIVILVFNSIWGNTLLNSLIISILLWTSVLSIFLTLPSFAYSGLIFLVAIPMQIIIIFWFILVGLRKKELKDLLRIGKKNNQKNLDSDINNNEETDKL